MQAYSGIQVRRLDRTDFLDRVPKLTPHLRFAGVQKTEIRLVVGIGACHYFDVGAELPRLIWLSQIAIPGITEFMVAPRPLFLARRDMMVRVVDDTGLRGVIIAAKEISLTPHTHVRGRNRNVGVKREVV